ncbi:MAG: nitroreductase [Carbonactinosporaceae bacterium]
MAVWMSAWPLSVGLSGTLLIDELRALNYCISSYSFRRMDNLDFLPVIAARHCVRAFQDRPVPVETLTDVLRAAANAPSTRNIQPWHVEVLVGPARDALAKRLCEAFDARHPTKHDYVNRPVELDKVAQRRSAAFGTGIYGVKGIARDDQEARHLHIRDNFRFFDAPVEMIFHLPGNAVAGTFLEMGLFLQNVLVGLVAAGLGSCPQYSVAGYSDVIRECLGLTPDRLIVCGLAVGHPDGSAPVNTFYPERAALHEYVRWHE